MPPEKFHVPYADSIELANYEQGADFFLAYRCENKIHENYWLHIPIKEDTRPDGETEIVTFHIPKEGLTVIGTTINKTRLRCFQGLKKMPEKYNPKENKLQVVKISNKFTIL